MHVHVYVFAATTCNLSNDVFDAPRRYFIHDIAVQTDSFGYFKEMRSFFVSPLDVTQNA